jgi:penicillin-binding protein 1C
VSDGAILVVNNGTGEILAYVGNGGSDSSAMYVDGIRARRQAGSTLKPFLYALAIENRIITAASLMSDVPLDVATERGVYRPENYDRQFKGLVPARIALASSINIPAVRVLMLTGTDAFVQKLSRLGFGELRDGDYYGYSLALGTLDVTLFELTNAYRTLANGGIRGDLTLVPVKGKNKTARVFSREASFIISDILSDREARSITFGLENPLSTRFWSAVKTGTSKDMRDNWCVGFSSKYTVGVWVGNFSGSAMWDVSGITGAAPIWHEIMAYLHSKERSLSPQPPSGVVTKQFSQEAGKPSKREWFLTGTEPVSVGAGQAAGKKPKIIYPPDEIIFAIDPDIPDGQQKIFFEATGDSKDFQWFLNGTLVGHGAVCPWAPAGGSYTLKLTDNNARVLDEMTFKVRD